MIKKIILLTVVFPVLIFGQEQGIELPDFVITGVKKVSIPVVKKKKAELYSTLSKDFILPKKSPVDFKLLELTKPETADTNFIKSKLNNNADLFLGAGINTLPVGDFNLSLNSAHYLFNTKIFGMAENDFTDNAGYNISGIKIKNDFFISASSSFLPGASFTAFGSYIRDDYKLYGNKISGTKRERRNLTFGLGLKEYVYSNMKFKINLLNEYFTMPDDFDLKENNLTLNGNLGFGLKQFYIFNRFDLTTQTLDSNKLNKKDFSYFNINSLASIRVRENLEVKGGIDFSKGDDKSYFYPQIFLKYKISKGAYLSASFSPHTEFITNNKLLKQNRFVNINNFTNNITEIKNELSVNFVYEYYTSFRYYISGKLKKSDNFPVFDYDGVSGSVNYLVYDDITENQLLMGLFLDAGKNGKVFAELKYNNSDLNGMQVPGLPELDFEGSYFFEITEKISGGLILDYKSGIISNNTDLDAFFDLGFKFNYKLNNSLQLTLELSNLLDNENKLIYNYISKSRDALLGIKYNW